MKFTHMADCHIGSWRDPKLKDVSTQAFVKAAKKPSTPIAFSELG